MGEEISTQSIEGAIDQLLGIGRLQDLVLAYLEGPPLTQFAGTLFDELEPNHPFKIESSDLVAVSLLDVRFGSRAVQKLLLDSALEDELRRLPDKSPLWQVDATVLAALDDALDTLCSLNGVGRTKATKLLARKRPLLAPITDSLVESFYGSKNWNHLRPLAAVLAERRDIIEAFREMVENVGKRQPSVLRVIDIAIWMTQSNAKSAKEARNRILGDSAPIRRKA